MTCHTHTTVRIMRFGKATSITIVAVPTALVRVYIKLERDEIKQVVLILSLVTTTRCFWTIVQLMTRTNTSTIAPIPISICQSMKTHYGRCGVCAVNHTL